VDVVPVVDVVLVSVPPDASESAPAGTVRSGVDFGTWSPTVSSAPQADRPRAVVASTAASTAAGRERIRTA
jgi:hypothetical protein